MVAGFWDETLFPVFKDLVRYGADKIAPQGGEDLLSMAVDAAAMALGTVAPQLIPFAEMTSQAVKPFAASASKALADKLRAWTDRSKVAGLGYTLLRSDLAITDIDHGADATDDDTDPPEIDPAPQDSK